MPTLPSGSNPSTISGAFVRFYLNGIEVASGKTLNYGMQFQGDWEQTMGTDRPTRNPNTKWGTGTLDRVRIYGNDLKNVLTSANPPIFTAQQIATSGIDLRFVSLTAQVTYADGNKTITDTLNECYILKEEKQVEGNRIQHVNIPFEYSYETAA